MSHQVRTRVAIVGAGPAGLLLAHLLDLAGIDSVLIERQTPEHVAGRIRAGVLESSTVDVLRPAGLAGRLLAEGDEHHGIHLQWPGERHRIDFMAHVGRPV
jgi:p-hydroxybenzoate 3-monooxygenase